MGFVVPGVVENQDFAPRARKEVSKIGWFPLHAAPKGHYNVMPFMGRLKKIAANLRKKARKAKNGKHTLKVPQTVSKKQCNNLSPNARQQLDTSTKASKKRKGRKQPKHSQEEVTLARRTHMILMKATQKLLTMRSAEA